MTSISSPPVSTKIVDFELPPQNTPLRIRPAAHLASKEYIAKYEKAVELMKALPDDDPRSFKRQADIYSAYCTGTYHQLGFPDLDVQVHNSCLFLPFHRYYLYFHERILGKLINDPTFALPFWNWDAPAGMQIPAMFTNPNSPLYGKLRDPLHQPLKLINLDYNLTDNNDTDEQQISSNLSFIYRQIVSNGKAATLFMGSAYRRGHEPDPGQGSLENIANGLKIWCGHGSHPYNEDEGSFYPSGRDAMFYGLHANVDRMWDVWTKTLAHTGAISEDPEWLNCAFYFYDERGQTVRIRVANAFDSDKLGYGFQEMDIPWLKSRPIPRKIISKMVKDKESHHNPGVGYAAKIPSSTSITFPRKLDSVLRVEVPRPKNSRSKEEEKEEEEEVLMIKGIEVERDQFVKFDVYINDEDDPTSKPNNTEFAGSFVNVPHKHSHGKKKSTTLRLAISELLDDLDANDDDCVIVTLVPRGGSDVTSIGGIGIEFAS